MNTEERTERTDYTLEHWIVFLLALLFLLPFIANAQELPGDQSALLLKGSDGQYTAAPAVSSSVVISVTGPIVRTQISQTFRNTTGACTEGVYMFPLPEKSAVDTLRMRVGTRVVEGEIREKAQAQREYEQARSEGRKAALVEQHRPNVFTTSVASIMPDEEATVEIEYQEAARFENGEYSLRFPMVVATRYEPNGSEPIPTAPPVLHQMSLAVDLQPGYSLRKLDSNHRIRKQTLSQRSYRVELEDVDTTRDFELTWQPDLGTTPEATVLTEKVGNEIYALLLVTPPAATPVRIPRETVFIIDSSGSMEGASMEQAKEALLLALDDLRPSDTFNIIDFDSEARSLYPESQPADRDAVEKAKAFVKNLVADGGTEMMRAIRMALPAANPRPGVVRQVIFMTDGQVGNEQELFTYISSNLGDSRLFTVGIGSAPNSHFMRNAARFGRGTFTYVGDVQQVKERMGELFDKLSTPALTSVEVALSDSRAEMWPRRVPDLYRGEPLTIVLRLPGLTNSVTMTGRIGDQQWTKTLTVPPPSSNAGIGKLWARQKIESLTDGLSQGSDPAIVRNDVVAVAIEHHLVSQFTSLVAVDRAPEALSSGSCEPLVNETAEADEKQDGELPQTATPGVLLLLAGAVLMGVSITLSRISL